MTTSPLDGSPFVLLERPHLFPDFLEDPYPVYAEMRETGSVYPIPLVDDDGPGFYFVAGYEAARQAYLHEDLSVDNLQAYGFRKYRHALPENFVQPTGAKAMLNLDPPEHERLRNIVNRAFTPRRVAELRAMTVSTARELLRPAQANGRLDIVRELAEPLPAIVIAELLGLPPEDREQFQLWSSHLIGLQHLTDPEVAMQSYAALMQYLGAIVAERRKNPRADLISVMSATYEEGRLDEEELLTNAFLLLAAGHETTANLIGNGALALLRHPEELERLRRDPALIEGVVEEMLRYDSPVHQNWRAATSDLSLDGHSVPKGATVVILPAAANRDPGAFPNPDRFDITRSDNAHFSFGHGRHFCLGASLARMEAQVAFSILIDTFEELKPESLEPERKPNVTLRGPATLPVRV